MVVYGHLILEQAGLIGLDQELLDPVFGLLVRDFSGRGGPAGKASSTPAQQQGRWAGFARRSRRALRSDLGAGPVGLDGAYAMNP